MNIFFTNRIGWDNQYICIMRSWLSKSRRLRTAAMGFVRSVSQARLKSFDHRKVTCHKTNLIFLSRHLLIQTRTDSFRVSVYEPRDSRRNKTCTFILCSIAYSCKPTCKSWWDSYPKLTRISSLSMCVVVSFFSSV